MIDSQPSASKPGNPRVPSRPPQPGRTPSLLRDLGPSLRWKVQLELAPSEIALVYRQGLARGAEVCRRGSQEWRPLVTTRELRPALSGPSSFSDGLGAPARAGAALTVTRTYTQTLAIRDPSLAALLFSRPPATILPVFNPPPPPVVITRADTEAESAVTQPLPMRAAPSLPPENWSTDFTPALVARRPRWLELSLVASASMALTLLTMLLASRLLSRSSNAPLVDSGASHGSPSEPVPTESPRVSSFGPEPVIPVVPLHEIPVEHDASLSAARAGGTAGTESGPNRAELARALARATRAAQSCGPGPVDAQVVATFAPSGVARSIHFGASSPPAELRSCVLNAIARSRIAPFEGEPVTVSKTVRW